MGIKARTGVSGTGRTRAVEADEAAPVSLKCNDESTGTTSHLMLLPTSSAAGTYERPFPT